MSVQDFHLTIDTDNIRVIDALADSSELPKVRIKDALNKGAVWLHTRGREQRLRRATKTLKRGDRVSLYYDADVLQREPPAAQLIADERDYSIWHKPAGMLAQGTRYGDHCSLLRWSEKYFQPPRENFLVHRLDREAEGLILIAHTKKAADAFSKLWQQHRIKKQYSVIVEGAIGAVGSAHRIDTTLDGKECATEFTVVDFDATLARSKLAVTLITGRKHQIRRHLAGIGFALVGDPRYGSRRSDRGGENLALRAVALEFICPLRGDAKKYALE
ncbi:MAG: pseudouridine synthase [Verrucomicrobiaceae bacterium]|nr:pseudouridine synthase [Verrucomicrobiaceae bacterium]